MKSYIYFPIIAIFLLNSCIGMKERELFPFKINNKYGYVDNSGEMVLPPVFDSASNFSGDIAIVNEGGVFRIINKNGSVVKEILEESVLNLPVIVDDVVYVSSLKGQGLLDKKGNRILNCKYEEIGLFREGMVSVKHSGKWGFADVKGNIIINFIYDKASFYSEGTAAVKLNDKWGFIDKNGNWVIKPTYSSEPMGFILGYAVVKNDANKDIVIDKKGIEISPRDFIRWSKEISVINEKYIKEKLECEAMQKIAEERAGEKQRIK